jgi:hypothetical protein
MEQVFIRPAIACVPSQTGSPRGSSPGLPLIFEKLPDRASRIFWIERHASSPQSAKAGTANSSANIGTKIGSFISIARAIATAGL